MFAAVRSPKYLPFPALQAWSRGTRANTNRPFVPSIENIDAPPAVANESAFTAEDIVDVDDDA